MSPLFRSRAYPTWQKQGAPESAEIATGEWKKLLATYVDPGIDEALDAELCDFVARRTLELEA